MSQALVPIPYWNIEQAFFLDFYQIETEILKMNTGNGKIERMLDWDSKLRSGLVRFFDPRRYRGIESIRFLQFAASISHLNRLLHMIKDYNQSITKQDILRKGRHAELKPGRFCTREEKIIVFYKIEKYVNQEGKWKSRRVPIKMRVSYACLRREIVPYLEHAQADPDIIHAADKLFCDIGENQYEEFDEYLEAKTEHLMSLDLEACRRQMNEDTERKRQAYLESLP